MHQCVAGVKFCGGCKPLYDRAVLFETIKKRMGEQVQFVAPDSKGVNLILAIQGCDTACAELSPFQKLPIFIITCEKDVDRFCEFIERWTGMNS